MSRIRFYLFDIRNIWKYIILAVICLFFAVIAGTVLFANAAPGPLEGRYIIIDPGHGGVDGGTNDGHDFLEKDVNLAVALKLKKVLEAQNARVDLTRSSDVSLDKLNSSSSSRHVRDLRARVDKFNSGKYDIYISLHVNNSQQSRAIGPFVLYSKELPSSKLLAESVQQSLNIHSQCELDASLSLKPLSSDYFLLRNSRIPGLIIETGFISNPKEKKLLRDAQYQEKLAQSVGRGVLEYFNRMRDINMQDIQESSPDKPEDADGRPMDYMLDPVYVMSMDPSLRNVPFFFTSQIHF